MIPMDWISLALKTITDGGKAGREKNQQNAIFGFVVEVSSERVG